MPVEDLKEWLANGDKTKPAEGIDLEAAQLKKEAPDGIEGDEVRGADLQGTDR